MKTKIRKELFSNEDHRSVVSSSKSKSSSSKSISTKGLEICDMCGEVRKLYIVNMDKDYKEKWCEQCMEGRKKKIIIESQS